MKQELPVDVDAQAEKLTELMPRLFRGIIRREDNFLTQGKISFPQMIAIQYLCQHGPSRMGDLAEVLSIQMASATGMVNRLLKAGYVKRSSDKEDRRVVKIAVTDKGKKIVETVYQQRKGTFQVLFHHLSAEDRRQYIRIIEKVCDILSWNGPHPKMKEKHSNGHAKQLNGLKGALVKAALSGLMLLGCVPAWAAGAGSPAHAVTVDDISRLAVAESLGIRVQRIENDAFAEEAQVAEGVYDHEFYSSVVFLRDEKPSSSVFAGTRTDTTDVDAGVRKLFFPTGTGLDVGFESHRLETNSVFVSDNPTYESRGKAMLSQPLWNNAFGVVDRLRLEQVRVDVERFNYTMLRRMEDSLLQVRAAFWKTHQMRRIAMIHKKGLREAWSFYTVTRDKLRLGMLEKPDIFAAGANIKTRLNEVLVAVNAAQDAENELKLLLSLPINGRLFLAVERGPEPPVMDAAFLTREAMRLRFDRQAAILETKKQDLGVKMSSSELWPRLDLEATLYLNGLHKEFYRSAEEALDGELPTYALGISVDVPLENRAARGRHKQAGLEQQRAILELDKTEQRIEKEVDEAFREVLTYRLRLVNTRRIVELQTQKLEEETKRFHQGRSGSKFIIDYHLDVLRAKDLAARALAEYRIAIDGLNHAAGILYAPYAAAEGGVV